MDVVTYLAMVTRGEIQDPATAWGRGWQKLTVFWQFTQGLASLSCCRRLWVGAVVFRPDFSEVLAIGYNGPPAGLPNDGCRETEGACGCAHAEGSALVKLRGDLTGLVMMTTVLQCEHCAGLLINSRRVAAVVYGKEYRLAAGGNLLRQAGIVACPVAALGLGSG